MIPVIVFNQEYSIRIYAYPSIVKDYVTSLCGRLVLPRSNAQIISEILSESLKNTMSTTRIPTRNSWHVWTSWQPKYSWILAGSTRKKYTTVLNTLKKRIAEMAYSKLFPLHRKKRGTGIDEGQSLKRAWNWAFRSRQKVYYWFVLNCKSIREGGWRSESNPLS